MPRRAAGHGRGAAGTLLGRCWDAGGLARCSRGARTGSWAQAPDRACTNRRRHAAGRPLRYRPPSPARFPSPGRGRDRGNERRSTRRQRDSCALPQARALQPRLASLFCSRRRLDPSSEPRPPPQDAVLRICIHPSSSSTSRGCSRSPAGYSVTAPVGPATDNYYIAGGRVPRASLGRVEHCHHEQSIHHLLACVGAIARGAGPHKLSHGPPRSLRPACCLQSSRMESQRPGRWAVHGPASSRTTKCSNWHGA